MGTQASSVYQQVMEKTKGLLFKCQVLEQNYEKKKKSGNSDNYAVKVRNRLFLVLSYLKLTTNVISCLVRFQ